MKTVLNIRIAPLLLLVISLPACFAEKPIVPKPLIQGALTENLEKVLQGSDLTAREKECVRKDVATDVYQYFDVFRDVKGGKNRIIIDQYVYEGWTDSVTGEKGKSKHGSKTVYINAGSKWEPVETMFYGG